MNQNLGKGKVVAKNVEMMSDTLARGEIAAVKHANGKDWWLVTPRRNSNQFYVFKFTSQGIVDTFQQTLGILPDPQGEGLGQMAFSPDGSKLYRTYRYNPVMVYSFDREAGVFTQFDTIPFDYGNQLVGEIGCAVSSDSRFLYLGCRKFLYQLDTWASDISASQTTVAEWDGFTTPFPTLFYQLQLAPDCKIYGLAGGDTRYYHVVHDPDEPGLACNVEQRGVKFQTPTGASMPSFPNYRLGPLDNPGVPCTATVSVNNPLPATEKNTVQVWPNPATDEFTLSYSLPQARGESRLILTDPYGRVVHETRLQGAAGRVAVRTEGWAAGVYFFSIASNEVGLSSGKIIVQR
ncbi:MAG: T9SS type A sorting domain-containing protein [Saprospiraceae bacterium]|nr:T9SS type A sorting domain-containing protein [Saprospiraceae bacterium]